MGMSLLWTEITSVFWSPPQKIQTYIPLPYTFNVKNSVQLIEDLSKITINPSLQFASFDISNMYSNVPTGDLLHISDLICGQKLIEDVVKNDLINMAKIVL
jgi:hypothetical protein